MKIRKAVVAAAGLGTRSLPATKVQPEGNAPAIKSVKTSGFAGRERNKAGGIRRLGVVKLKPELRVMDVGTELTLTLRLGDYSAYEITDLKIWVSDGVVYLGGYVPDLKHKKLAGDVAGSMGSVREVINMLRVTPRPFEVRSPQPFSV